MTARADTATSASTGARSEAEAHKRVIQEFCRSLTERRTEDLGRYLRPDVIDHNKVIHGEPDEPGAAFEGFRQQLAAFGEFEAEARQLVAEGDTVVARLLVRGTHTGHHPRMPEPTGRSFAVEQIWIFTFREGRISEIRAVGDRLGMFLQLGWDWPTAD
ncbi:ester cyclase [Streptomyces sp. NPDC003077]|uniref:ester cyclase n=1 Tax=Streptomyces sp. NPDC003077 TaxID=3154443 RepID=UPI0033B96F72